MTNGCEQGGSYVLILGQKVVRAHLPCASLLSRPSGQPWLRWTVYKGNRGRRKMFFVLAVSEPHGVAKSWILSCVWLCKEYVCKWCSLVLQDDFTYLRFYFQFFFWVTVWSIFPFSRFFGSLNYFVCHVGKFRQGFRWELMYFITSTNIVEKGKKRQVSWTANFCDLFQQQKDLCS